MQENPYGIYTENMHVVQVVYEGHEKISSLLGRYEIFTLFDIA